MENTNESNVGAEETSQSFVVRMWQEEPGQWRGTVRHVQSQVQLGFTEVEQASRFIRRYTTEIGKRQSDQIPSRRPAFNFNLVLSRRTTRMLAFAAVLILLSVVGLLAVGHGSLNQVLGFGH